MSFDLFQFLTVLRERVEKREAEKLVKHVIKAAVKLGVLRRHGQLSPADERALGAFRSKFHVSVPIDMFQEHCSMFNMIKASQLGAQQWNR